MEPVDSPYYTVKETARKLKKHPDTIRSWCENGELEGARKIGRDWYIPKTSVDPQPPPPHEQHEAP